MLRRLRGGATVAYASWNGATQVARWELLEGGPQRLLERTALLRAPGSKPRSRLPDDRGARFVAVRALDGGGATLGTSATLALAGVSGG